jgi:hypothetical protein
MKTQQPSYWKARLDAIMQLIAEEKGGDRTAKNNHSVLLRNGVVPVEMKKRYDEAFNEHHKTYIRTGKVQPLSFAEITRFNTWFEIHPEKVAGKEIITTSREFPISVKGSETDILMTITKTLQDKQKTKTSGEKQIREATLIPDKAKRKGYKIKMLDGKPFQGSYTDTFGWYRDKEDGIKAIVEKKLKYVPTGKNNQDKEKQLRIIKAKAEAKLKLLKLLKI